MNAERLNEAVVTGIAGSAVPGVDRAAILHVYGPDEGPAIFDEVLALVREAGALPIEWGSMTLVEGVDDIMARFSALHPELDRDALFQIGRCVGWMWR
ncbi:hypothetical protein E3G68_005291 [Mycobacteroides abscessus]|uniref:hypothetical protein n=1 Tax=Mycobacteroides abscessus TaxID=36809 RepID=UPI001877F4D5|nr:hypothetical protein [Mycobacteroides abscessus]